MEGEANKNDNCNINSTFKYDNKKRRKEKNIIFPDEPAV